MALDVYLSKNTDFAGDANHLPFRDGAVTGPGTSLTWAIRYFWRALTGSNKAATALTLPLFWLRFFDRFAKSGYGLDAANGVYFLGIKSQLPPPLTSSELIDYYKGGRVAM